VRTNSTTLPTNMARERQAGDHANQAATRRLILETLF
jgi:hypothetical protein